MVKLKSRLRKLWGTIDDFSLRFPRTAALAIVAVAVGMAAIGHFAVHYVPEDSGRAIVKAVDAKSDLLLPEGWSQTLVRFTFEGCQFVGVQHGYTVTSVWHSPKCPCGK